MANVGCCAHVWACVGVCVLCVGMAEYMRGAGQALGSHRAGGHVGGQGGLFCSCMCIYEYIYRYTYTGMHVYEYIVY